MNTSCSYPPGLSKAQVTALLLAVGISILAMWSLPVQQWYWVAILFLIIAPMFYCTLSSLFPKKQRFTVLEEANNKRFVVKVTLAGRKQWQEDWVEYSWEEVKSVEVDEEAHQIQLTTNDNKSYLFSQINAVYLQFLENTTATNSSYRKEIEELISVPSS